ncbi:hypothetical protein F7725_021583 [Dissostichus mawsoni]|uniref:Nuclear-interacting partner of ALK n=1 Tax=Dissostichus mawsoni TaxID=36200 RepID=A0A7J5ZBL7_DISMA|nr:hypothetical protein F7725_021583 [Dissostichus mawsoni]
MGKGLEELLPAELQQAGPSQPDLKQRASSLVLMDVHHTTVDPIMATLSGSRGDRLGNTNQRKSSFASPEKVRALLNAGVSPAQVGPNSKQENGKVLEVKSNTQAPCKPRTLSPLICARYGWINVGCDMLKCSSCQAFLCATLQPTLDFEKYGSRIAEISRQLQSQHEKFCPWPDFPSPESFWLVPACEPSALLTAFLERFQSACLLAQQLPAMKPEQLKSMSLTEEAISVILQLIEDEHKRKRDSPCSEPLAVQVAACIVSLCGWSASPALHAMNLPILRCSYCMRKVGLWNFFQMEGTLCDGEGTASPVFLRARSRDSPSPVEELQSPLGRGKRTATRGRGQGESPGAEGPASPRPPPKRLCLSSVGGPDDLLPKNTFDPLAQHRDWCPWVSAGKENVDPGVIPFLDGDSGPRDKSKRVFAIFRQWQASFPSQ